MKFYLLIFTSIVTLSLEAQIPTGYYDAARGKSGATLRTALSGIISNANTLDYGMLYDFFPLTDALPDSVVWDMYSYVYGQTQNYVYTYGTHECDGGLNYNSEGDCYNKEHIWPQSLFGQNLPMRSDLHQVYPTDGWVNNKRSNFPFGKVTTVSWTSTNGSKLGSSTTYAGYSGNVFEPIDSFKGDIARSIFYFSTRYASSGTNFSDWPMATGTVLKADAINLLLDWHHLDPVSKKEVDRNNAVYALQSNRNPFVDYPLFADCIWGQDCTPFAINENVIPQLYELSADNLVVKGSRFFEKVDVYTILGEHIMNKTNVESVSLERLEPGMYIIKVQVNQSSQSLKYLKN